MLDAVTSSAPTPLSEAEYLALERASDRKHEFVVLGSELDIADVYRGVVFDEGKRPA